MTKPLPPHLRKTRTTTNYAAMVGTDRGEWRITGTFHNGRAPMFGLRCLAKDHEHTAPAWETTHKTMPCPFCKGGRAASRAGAQRKRKDRAPIKRVNGGPAETGDAPEVCACAWFNGRLVRACQQHAARGAA